MCFAMMPSGASVCVALLRACLCSQVFGNKFTCFCYVRKLSQDCTGLMWLSSLSFFAVVEIKIYLKNGNKVHTQWLLYGFVSNYSRFKRSIQMFVYFDRVCN